MCFEYVKEADAVKNDILVINGKQRYTSYFNVIADKPNNVVFDLQNFGYLPRCKKSLLEVYDGIVFDGDTTVLGVFQCRDLLQNKNLDDSTKKYLLDNYALITAGIQILVSLQDKASFLKQYAAILSNIFIVGAKIEKLIFLVAKIDDSLNDEELVERSGKVTTTFLKKSEESEFALTKKLRDMAKNIEHFKDQFRTPEAHKRGRMLPLITDGHYGTLLNEILSYSNSLNGFFGEVVEYLRSLLKQKKGKKENF